MRKHFQYGSVPARIGEEQNDDARPVGRMKRSMNMKKRVLALLLALVMLLGVMAGCSKKGTSDTPDDGTSANKPTANKVSQPEKAEVTAKYAYKAEFKDITCLLYTSDAADESLPV